MANVQILGESAPPAVPGGAAPNLAAIITVGPAFFDTVQIPRIAGRDFTSNDSAGTPLVAIINERLAKVFQLTNPVGRTLTLGNKSYEIVGLVRDALAFSLKEEGRPIVYFSYLQNPNPPYAMTYEVRVNQAPRAYASTVHQLVRQMDVRLAVFDMKTQAEHIDQAISSEITLSRLCTVFAGLALIIACVGLYGTVAFNVERRTSEIGIRMALGARAVRILWMVLREVIVLAALGLAIGVPLVVAGSRFVKSFLYGIEPNDPLAIGFAVIILLFAGLIAGLIPARRASLIDPMVAIRHD
jgi:predicted permease